MSAVNVAQARRFAQEYVVDYNQTKAYMRAFRTKDADGNERSFGAIRNAACVLLTNPNAKAEIEASQEDLRKSCWISAKRMVRQLAAMATVDPADLFDEDGDRMMVKPIHKISPMTRRSILKIKVKQSRRVIDDAPFEIEEIEYVLQDRYPAIEKLCKRLGITKDDAEWAGLVAAGVAAIQAASKPNSDASKSKDAKAIQSAETQASVAPSLHIEPYDPRITEHFSRPLRD